MKQSEDEVRADQVTEEVSALPRQLRHDTGPNGGQPCSRCGLVFSRKTAYIPCFVEGDTLATWLARQPEEVQASTGLVDPRPKCIGCGARWVPPEGVDATTAPCFACLLERSSLGTPPKGSDHEGGGSLTYTVRYQAGPYSGTRTVNAEDEEHAVAIVRCMIHKDMTLPMYSESYRVVGQEDDE